MLLKEEGVGGEAEGSALTFKVSTFFPSLTSSFSNENTPQGKVPARFCLSQR